jgi:hypothetical protein
MGCLTLQAGHDVELLREGDGGDSTREAGSAGDYHCEDATPDFDPYADPYRGASRCRIVPVGARFPNTN